MNEIDWGVIRAFRHVFKLENETDKHEEVESICVRVDRVDQKVSIVSLFNRPMEPCEAVLGKGCAVLSFC
jgi:hypothetical protein